MFKVGDKVRKVDGGMFQDRYEILTVDCVDSDGKMWFKEIWGWLAVNTTYVELVEPRHNKRGFASWVSALETSSVN